MEMSLCSPMDLDLAACLRRFPISRPGETLGVVHVGAHDGEEISLYDGLGITRQVWIEPQPEVYAKLLARLDDATRAGGERGARSRSGARPVGVGAFDRRAFNVACGAEPGVARMHLLSGNEGRSNSLLEPRLHLERFPEFKPAGEIEVAVERLDDLMRRHSLAFEAFPLLALDVQGFEMQVLRGAEEYLRRGVRAIVCEVSAVELYSGGSLVGEIDRFLASRGFTRVRTKWAAGCAGDAFYCRSSLLGVVDRVRTAMFGGRGHRPPRKGAEVKKPEPSDERPNR
jgi:FkbM family methyltransferase